MIGEITNDQVFIERGNKVGGGVGVTVLSELKESRIEIPRKRLATSETRNLYSSDGSGYNLSYFHISVRDVLGRMHTLELH